MIRRLLADERVRFLLVGGINTLVGYGLFALFQWSLGRSIGYLGSLVASYAIATVIAFSLHRKFTFRVRSGQPFIDFARYAGVTAISLLLNAGILALFVEVAHWNPYFAQALSLITTTVVSYVGHKWFSFRRPAAPPSALPKMQDIRPET